MTSLSSVPRIRRSTGHVMPIVALALIFLAAAAVSVATIAADPVLVDAETAVIYVEGRGASDWLPDEDREADPNRVSALGSNGSPGTADPLLASPGDPHGSTHGNGGSIASRREVHAYLHAAAAWIHAPVSFETPLPHCYPCAAASTAAKRSQDRGFSAANVPASD